MASVHARSRRSSCSSDTSVKSNEEIYYESGAWHSSGQDMGLALFPYGNPSPPMTAPEFGDASSLRDAKRRHERCALEPHDRHELPHTTADEVGFYHGEARRFAGEAWHGKRCVLTKLTEQLRADSRHVRTPAATLHASHAGIIG